MKRIVFLALALLGAIVPAHAQQATTVSSCGSITWDTAGVPRPITQDLNGLQCTGATVSGGATAAKQPPFTAADGSTTITLGGTAQNLFSGATPTNGWSIINPDASEDCWVSDTTTAATNNTGSIRVAANGGGYETPVGRKPLGAVSVVCATTGHKLTASKW